MIGTLTDSDVTDIIPALNQVMRRDLVRPGQEGRRLALRHPLIRTLVHESINPWQREELHRRAAAELARAGASVVERAHHLLPGGPQRHSVTRTRCSLQYEGGRPDRIHRRWLPLRRLKADMPSTSFLWPATSG